jgi:iron complex outermembrane receptor protein
MKIRTVMVAGFAVAGAGQALAQTAGPAEGGVLEEIVVTSQKRVENVQDIPLAVQVVSGDTLERQGIREFSELTRAAPSLFIRPAEHPVNASISMRGIGTFAFSQAVEPSVAVQMDDVPVQFLARAFADLSDIERVEVLRGPQSTLYGRAASAGLLNITTRGPTSELGGRVAVSGSNDDEYTVNGSISGPLGDNLGFRFTGNYDDYAGNVTNLFNGDKINGRRIVSTRGKLVWDPTDKLNITGQMSYIDGSTSIGRPFIRVSPDARLQRNAALGPSVFAPGVTFSEDNTDVVNNYNSGTEYFDFAPSVRASLDLGFASLVSITAWDHFHQLDVLDQDESALAAPFDNRQRGTFDVKARSQELRLVSAEKKPLAYTLGLFYSDLDIVRDFARGPFFALARWYATTGTKQYAAFGQMDYEVVENTTLTGGVRVGHYDIDYTFFDQNGVGGYFSGDDSETYETYRASAEHRFTPDVMAFASFATGHKGQAYDISTGFNLVRQNNGPTKAEKSKDYEIGLKSQLLDHRVTLNTTLFTTTFDNFQAQGIETLSDGSFNFRLTNVGKLRTRGVEVEGAIRPSSEFNFSGGVTYTDAKILSYPFGQCYPGQTAAQGCSGTPARQNLAGFRPAQAPVWKLAVTGEYTPALTSSLQGLLQLSYTYQSTFNFGLNNDPETIQHAYGIANLSLGVRSSEGKWEVAGFVNNLFDKLYFFNMNDSFGNQGNAQAVQSNLPRDMKRYGGVRASYNF